MNMKYFILYHGDEEYGFREFYLKGKSLAHMEDRIKNYSVGSLSTNKGTLYTSNIQVGFLLEVNPSEHQLSKSDFGIINENQSYSLSELREDSF